MICPKCEYEFVDDVKVCPDCQVELISRDEFEGHLVHHEDWVVAYTTSSEIEAQMMKSNLEGADIESLILSQKDRNYPTVGDLSIIKLLVQKKDAADALAIIQDINNSSES